MSDAIIDVTVETTKIIIKENITTLIVEQDPNIQIAMATQGPPGPPGPPGLLGPVGPAGSPSYTRRADATDPDSIYIGDAAPGSLESAAAWRVFRADFIDNDIVKTYADGTDAFDKIWDNRATYTY